MSSEPFMRPRILIAILIATLLLAPAATRARSIAEPNDPYYPDQWALTHVGAPCAWDRTIGSPEVTVAVVDSGVDMRHPDLVDRLRTGAPLNPDVMATWYSQGAQGYTDYPALERATA